MFLIKYPVLLRFILAFQQQTLIWFWYFLQVYNAIQEAINRANAKAISSAQRVQKFTILPRDFSVTTGELSKYVKFLY